LSALTSAEQAVIMTLDMEEVKSAIKDITELVKEKSCGPILIRLGWHDAGTYEDVRSSLWALLAGMAATQNNTSPQLQLPSQSHIGRFLLASALFIHA
jgi:hypothetical protein